MIRTRSGRWRALAAAALLAGPACGGAEFAASVGGPEPPRDDASVAADATLDAWDAGIDAPTEDTRAGDARPPPDAAKGPAVACPVEGGATTCAVGQVCCETGAAATATFACSSAPACPEGCGGNNTPISCNGADDCPDGGVCCGVYCGRFAFVRCTRPSDCPNADGGRLVCSAANVAKCGCGTPLASTTLPGYYYCPGF